MPENIAILTIATTTVPKIRENRPSVCIVVCSALASVSGTGVPSSWTSGTASMDMASATASWRTRPQGPRM